LILGDDTPAAKKKKGSVKGASKSSTPDVKVDTKSEKDVSSRSSTPSVEKQKTKSGK